jgi:hypothetical protein
MLGGDLTDIGNNALSGALSGFGSGVLGNLGKAANAVRPGVGQAMGSLGGVLLDSAVYGADPMMNRCE